GRTVKARFDLPPNPADKRPLPFHLHPKLKEALLATGLAELYSHQALGLCALAEGNDLLLSTPTASGKSLVYQLYAIDAWLRDPRARGLFIYPYKALAQDQCGKINELAASLGFPEFRAAIYDGDTPASERQRLQKAPPPLLLTNPDMLHMAFLAYSKTGCRFSANSRPSCLTRPTYTAAYSARTRATFSGGSSGLLTKPRRTRAG
ncbi:MAG: DEAD/DEAH box helicase, partial [Acidobacteria bacterium]|nr:DEAD/DEAH box helicase [Acidobacteriota bacterium]